MDSIERAKDLFKLNERVFDIVGVWPLHPTYIKFTIWIVYLSLHLTMLMVDLFNQFGDFEAVVLNLTETTLSIMIFFKMFVMRFSRTLTKLMSRIIDSVDEKFFESSEEIEVYLNYNRIAEIFFKLWVAMGMTTATAFNLKPLEYRFKAVLQNETMPFVLLSHRTSLFFEFTESSTFWLVWLFQCPMGIMSIYHVATIGYLFTLVLHVCGRLSVLVFRIKNLQLDSHETRESSRTIFRDISDRHLDVLELTREINRVFGFILLEELLIATLLIGLTSYNALQTVGSEETGLFLSYLLYGSTILLLIYGYCVAGQYLITESRNLYEAYYQCQWYNMSEPFKKQLIICMIGATKSIELNASGFYIFSSVSFMSILKSSAGYISMLRTMT